MVGSESKGNWIGELKMSDLNKGVSSPLYNALVTMARNAARLEERVADSITDGIRAVATDDTDLDTFDRTYELFVSNMRKQNLPVPLAIESMHGVVHAAVSRGVSLSDENGVPRHFSELQAATTASRVKRKYTRRKH